MEYTIWATSWENLFLPYANNKGADQPAHPRSLISAFVIRCLDSIIPLVSIPKISSLWLASLLSRPVWVLPGRRPRRQVFSWRGSYVLQHGIWLTNRNVSIVIKQMIDFAPDFAHGWSESYDAARPPTCKIVELLCWNSLYILQHGWW